MAKPLAYCQDLDSVPTKKLCQAHIKQLHVQGQACAVVFIAIDDHGLVPAWESPKTERIHSRKPERRRRRKPPTRPTPLCTHLSKIYSLYHLLTSSYIYLAIAISLHISIFLSLQLLSLSCYHPPIQLAIHQPTNALKRQMMQCIYQTHQHLENPKIKTV